MIGELATRRFFRRRSGAGFEAIDDLAYFRLVLLFLRGRDPVGHDDELVLDGNEDNADRCRSVVILALVKQLGRIECPDLEFVLFLVTRRAPRCGS